MHDFYLNIKGVSSNISIPVSIYKYNSRHIPYTNYVSLQLYIKMGWKLLSGKVGYNIANFFYYL